METSWSGWRRRIEIEGVAEPVDQLARRPGDDFGGDRVAVGQAVVILETVGRDQRVHSGADRRRVVAVLVTTGEAARGVDRQTFAQRAKVRQLVFAERNADQKIQARAVDVVTFEHQPNGLIGIDGDVARDDSDANVGRLDQALQQGRHVGKHRRLAAVDLGERVLEPLAILFVELPPQVFRELAQPAQILEQLAPALEAREVAEVHAVPRESELDRKERVDQRPVEVENHQAILTCVHRQSPISRRGRHAANIAGDCDRGVTDGLRVQPQGGCYAFRLEPA